MGQMPEVRIVRQKFKKKLFQDSQILNVQQEGYFRIEPLPAPAELNRYYAEEYWQHRSDRGQIVNARDVSHYLDIRNTVPEFFLESSNLILNFGSGHGGVTNLFLGLGYEVIEVDPSKKLLDEITEKNRFEYNRIQDVPETTFDLIYSSHALEHVSAVHEILREFQRLSNEETLFLFEVPDGEVPGQGGGDGKIVTPHTYYFTKAFFRSHFKDVYLCSNVSAGNPKTHRSSLREESGLSVQDSIRFIGRGIYFSDSCLEEY